MAVTFENADDLREAVGIAQTATAKLMNFPGDSRQDIPTQPEQSG
jgi:hypothetical protein